MWLRQKPSWKAASDRKTWGSLQRAQLSSLCSLVIHRVCNTHMCNWITLAGLYNGFLHISAQEYQVETTFDICKCLERQLLFNYKNILESSWQNSDIAGRRLTNLSFVKENFDRWQFLSIGIYRLEKVLFSLLKTRNGCKKKSVLPTSGVPLVLINSFIMGFFFFMGGRRIPHLATYSSLDGSSWNPLS